MLIDLMEGLKTKINSLSHADCADYMEYVGRLSVLLLDNKLEDADANVDLPLNNQPAWFSAIELALNDNLQHAAVGFQQSLLYTTMGLVDASLSCQQDGNALQTWQRKLLALSLCNAVVETSKAGMMLDVVTVQQIYQYLDWLEIIWQELVTNAIGYECEVILHYARIYDMQQMAQYYAALHRIEQANTIVGAIDNLNISALERDYLWQGQVHPVVESDEVQVIAEDTGQVAQRAEMVQEEQVAVKPEPASESSPDATVDNKKKKAATNKRTGEVLLFSAGVNTKKYKQHRLTEPERGVLYAVIKKERKKSKQENKVAVYNRARDLLLEIAEFNAASLCEVICRFDFQVILHALQRELGDKSGVELIYARLAQEAVQDELQRHMLECIVNMDLKIGKQTGIEAYPLYVERAKIMDNPGDYLVNLANYVVNGHTALTLLIKYCLCPEYFMVRSVLIIAMYYKQVVDLLQNTTKATWEKIDLRTCAALYEMMLDFIVQYNKQHYINQLLSALSESALFAVVATVYDPHDIFVWKVVANNLSLRYGLSVDAVTEFKRYMSCVPLEQVRRDIAIEIMFRYHDKSDDIWEQLGTSFGLQKYCLGVGDIEHVQKRFLQLLDLSFAVHRFIGIASVEQLSWVINEQTLRYDAVDRMTNHHLIETIWNKLTSSPNLALFLRANQHLLDSVQVNLRNEKMLIDSSVVALTSFTLDQSGVDFLLDVPRVMGLLEPATFMFTNVVGGGAKGSLFGLFCQKGYIQAIRNNKDVVAEVKAQCIMAKGDWQEWFSPLFYLTMRDTGIEFLRQQGFWAEISRDLILACDACGSVLHNLAQTEVGIQLLESRPDVIAKIDRNLLFKKVCIISADRVASLFELLSQSAPGEQMLQQILARHPKLVTEVVKNRKHRKNR